MRLRERRESVEAGGEDAEDAVDCMLVNVRTVFVF